MDRRVTPPRRVTSPTWGPPLPCKQAHYLTNINGKWKWERRSGWVRVHNYTHISTGTAHGGHGIGTNSAGFEADLNPAGQPLSGV